MKRINFGLLFLVCGMAIVGCDLKEELDKAVTPAEASEAIEEDVAVNRIFQAVSNNADESILSGEATLVEESLSGSACILLMPDPGPTITVTPLGSNWPKTITVDFGTTGIEGADGMTRRGIMTIISTARYSQTNSTHTTTFNNYYQNDHKIEGTHVAKNLGLFNEALKFSVNISDGKVTTPEGDVIRYTQSTERTWVAGGTTPLNVWDDEYDLSGTMSGVSSKGVNYTMQIIEPLHFIVSPRDITGGTLEVDMDGLPTMLINYSDNTLTIGNYVHHIGS
jgi:hypothetical protein